jgi:hypothetical protein
MIETHVKIEINTFGDDNRKVCVSETFEEDLTISQIEDVFYDALRAAGYFPDGK